MVAEQRPVELILARGLVSNLATPGFLVDEDGLLLFYNDAAGELLGVRFEEVGEMEPEEWGTRFEPVGPDGKLIPVDELPLARALQGEPAHSQMRITSVAGEVREIEVTALPILGTGGQKGALALFWSRKASA
jgi:PAS domain-containing protein